MKRVFAHHIIYGGRRYDMAVAELKEDGSIEIVPFEVETDATVFFSGTVEVESDGDRLSVRSVDN